MNPHQLADEQNRTRVLIIAGADPVGDWMASIVDLEDDMDFVGVVRDVLQAQESVRQLAPDVILVDVSSGILQHGDLINRLSTPLSGAAIIVVAVMSEMDVVRQAMLYGAQGFLLKPFSELELLSSIRQANDLIKKRRAEMSDIPGLLPSAQSEPLPHAEIITVFSPKGGVGCTTIAINLAVALKITTGQSVILVDGDLRFGDVDTALNIASSTSISSLLPHLNELDDPLLESSLVPHSSGIKVLIAPPQLDMADTIRPEQLGQLLTRLAELSEGYVVVDAWSALDDHTLSFLDASQHLIVVTTPQVTALRDTHRFLEVLKLLNFDSQNIVLVLNHCYQRSSLNPKDVERALGHPIAQTIEHAPNQVTASLNQGVPLLEAYRNSSAAKNILQLAELLKSRSAARQDLGMERESAQTGSEETTKRGLFFRSGPASTDGVKA